jgi:outer membrane protein assembly factor BamB
VGDYLFTQQQQGEDEVVVCYQSADGQPCWVNRHLARFSEVVSGAGPRATPTFCEGRLYTMGAHGAVQCLDASTGQQIWLRQVTEDAGAETPIWGFSSSPLIVGEMVVVFAGGPDGQSVICYDRQTGDIIWTGGEGKISYSSPQRVRLAETDMILMATESGLQALGSIDGRTIWHHQWPTGGMRIVQPQLIGDDQVLFGSGYGDGSRLLKITFDGDGWDAAEVWTTKALKPYFNDFVIHQGFVYGFDGRILTCIDLEGGRRRWKGGRYGYGQLLLLPAADVLLVLSETGEVVLVKAEPDEHAELCKFQAIEGKTWNHPVVAHGRLFVRNGQEAACFALE